MKIALIGPGIMPIPPDGWGAVESLIWEIANELTEKGHEGVIINTPDMDEIIQNISEDQYDFIHLFYDVFVPIMDEIKKISPNSITSFSSAYPYVDQFEYHKRDGYDKIFNWIVDQTDHYNFCLSDKDLNAYKSKGANQNNLLRLGLGAQHREFKFNTVCEKPDISLYMAKIEQRKRQWIYQSIDNIEFVGRYTNSTTFNKNNKNYIGEWTTKQKHKNVTKYANLVLLSNGENGTPLVIKEALVSGLGIVCSKYSAYDLDDSLPFIDVLDDQEMNDLDYVKNVLEKNRIISISMRNDIREYGIKNFSWQKIVDDYEKDIFKILN